MRSALAWRLLDFTARRASRRGPADRHALPVLRGPPSEQGRVAVPPVPTGLRPARRRHRRLPRHRRRAASCASGSSRWTRGRCASAGGSSPPPRTTPRACGATTASRRRSCACPFRSRSAGDARRSSRSCSPWAGSRRSSAWTCWCVRPRPSCPPPLAWSCRGRGHAARGAGAAGRRARRRGPHRLPWTAGRRRGQGPLRAVRLRLLRSLGRGLRPGDARGLPLGQARRDHRPTRAARSSSSVTARRGSCPPPTRATCPPRSRG